MAGRRPAPAGGAGPRPRRGAGPGGGGRQDERDPHVRHAAGPHRHRRGGHHRRCAARPARPRHLPGRARRAYLFTVKRNQPGLHAQLAALPWRQVPVACDTRERGHGRAERRTLKVTAVARGLAFPHAAQAIQIVRRRKAERQEVVRRNLLRGHLADRHPGQPRPARRHHPRPLDHRGPPALGPRHGLRRGPLPGPHRQRPPHHGQPAQPRHHHLAPGRRHPASPPPCATTPGGPAGPCKRS